MIKQIRIWHDNPQKDRISNVVRVEFNYKTDWCIFTITELKEILRLWIIGEEMKYPKEKGFQGRDMLFKEIKKVFYEENETKKQNNNLQEMQTYLERTEKV